MTTQTIQSVREELEKGCGERIFPITNPDNIKCGSIWANDNHYCQNCMDILKGFNLGVSLAQKELISSNLSSDYQDGYVKGKLDTQREFLDFLEDLLKADIHKEPYQFLKYSILETKIKMVYKIEELKQDLEKSK
jgi:hypothetical protein